MQKTKSKGIIPENYKNGFMELMRKRPGAVLAIVLSLTLLCVFPFFRIKFSNSSHDCLPYKVWLVNLTRKNVVPNDYVYFRAPRGVRHLAPESTVWIKVALAAEGETVKVIPAAKDETEIITVNGINKELPVRAHVEVGGKTFKAFRHDSRHTELPIITEQIIPPGFLYIYAPTKRSLDSRYWGLLSKDEVLGTAYPLF